jgi:hypothetical protein
MHIWLLTQAPPSSRSSVGASPAATRTMTGSLTAGMSKASAPDDKENTDICTSRQAGPWLFVSVSPGG